MLKYTKKIGNEMLAHWKAWPGFGGSERAAMLEVVQPLHSFDCQASVKFQKELEQQGSHIAPC